MDTQVKRVWCYVGKPSMYELPGCTCGNPHVVWSEYVDHLWCPNCKVDFIPMTKGLFDGPIGIEVCRLLGITFDRYEIATGRVVKFDDPEYDQTRP